MKVELYSDEDIASVSSLSRNFDVQVLTLNGEFHVTHTLGLETITIWTRNFRTSTWKRFKETFQDYTPTPKFIEQQAGDWGDSGEALIVIPTDKLPLLKRTFQTIWCYSHMILPRRYYEDDERENRRPEALVWDGVADDFFDNPFWPLYADEHLAYYIDRALAAMSDERREQVIASSFFPFLRWDERWKTISEKATRITILAADGSTSEAKVPKRYYLGNDNPLDYSRSLGRTARNEIKILREFDVVLRYKNRNIKSSDLIWLDDGFTAVHPRLDVLGADYHQCPTCSGFARRVLEGMCFKCGQWNPELFEIHEYSARATKYFSFKVNTNIPNAYKPIAMGVELELDGGRTDPATTDKVAMLLSSHCIMKRDGSVPHGIEIVSRPASIDEHEKHFRKFFENMPPKLKAASNCGMHVHIDRKSISGQDEYGASLQLGKITAFLNRVYNFGFISAVAGRTSSYAKFDALQDTVFPFKFPKGLDRYTAINLGNAQTVEFRIFKSTTSFVEFMKNLEFCQALVDYTRPGAIAASLKDQLDSKTFINYVRANRKVYPRLDEFFVSLNYLTPVKKAPATLPKEKQ